MNMKKIIFCILSLFLVINFLGCENKKTEIIDKVNINHALAIQSKKDEISKKVEEYQFYSTSCMPDHIPDHGGPHCFSFQ